MSPAKAPERHADRRRARRSRVRQRRPGERRPGRCGGGPSRVLAERRRLGRHAPDRLDERPRLRQPRPARLPGGRNARRQRAPHQLAAGREPGDVERQGRRHDSAERPLPREPRRRRRAEPTFFNPASAVQLRVAATLYGVTIDTVAPTVTSATVERRADLAERRRHPRHGPGHPRPRRAPTAGRSAAAPLAGSTSARRSRRDRAGWQRRRHLERPDERRRGRRRRALPPDAHRRRHAGNRAARSWTVRVDTTPPRSPRRPRRSRSRRTATASSDTTRLGWTSSERITGTARILRGTTVVRSWAITGGTAGSITWNGHDGGRHAVADGATRSGSPAATPPAT